MTAFVLTVLCLSYISKEIVHKEAPLHCKYCIVDMTRLTRLNNSLVILL